MKRILLTALLLAMLAGGAGAQTAENPKRTVLFTLEANEVIHYNEYLMCLSPNGYKFAAIIENRQTHEFTFVFNGKRIAKGDGIKDDDDGVYYEEPFNVFYLNPEKDDGYGYSLYMAGRYLTWLGNRLFPDVPNGIWGLSIRRNGRFAFGYREYNFKEYANIDGKIFGPYGNIRDVAITDNGRFAFSYRENDKWYANIDGKIFSPYQSVYSIAIADTGKFAFSYSENDKWYANIDGKIFGPYQSVYSIAIADNGKFAFSYRENDKWYANIDGKIFGPSGNVWNVAIADNGRFAFSYYENDKWYANIDGKIFGPYEHFNPDVAIADNGRFAFSYRENDKWNYNVNGENVSAYDYRIALAEIKGKEPDFDFNNSKYGNGFMTNDKIELSDGRHIFYSDAEYDYAVIDGMHKVGKSPAIHAYHDKTKNAFVWNAIEGKELVAYEYKLD
ncbi:MAG: hypothetical protein LBF81_07085 [Prevotellaceae bacterium]|jgi:hypothetical protein|nr:hypothetical protein [Prevotellaceae bacterium]